MSKNSPSKIVDQVRKIGLSTTKLVTTLKRPARGSKKAVEESGGAADSAQQHSARQKLREKVIESRSLIDKKLGAADSAESLSSDTIPGPIISGQPVIVQDRISMIGLIVSRMADWSIRFVIMVAALWALAKVIGLAWEGVLPVLIALIICSLLQTPTRWMCAVGAPRWLGALVSVLGALGLVVGLFSLVIPSAVDQSGDLARQFIAGLKMVQEWLQTGPLHLTNTQLSEYLDTAIAKLQASSETILNTALSGVNVASSTVVMFGLILMVTFFFLKDGVRFLPFVEKIAGHRGGIHIRALLEQSWATLGGFIRAQALVSLIDSIFIGAGLVIMGIPLALPLALLTFCGGFVPIVGAIITGILAVVVALVTKGIVSALIVVGIIVAVQQLEGNVLSPILQSKAMNLHPALVLLSVLVGSDLFGIVGAFLAVPATATAAVWVRYINTRIGARVDSKVAALTTGGPASTDTGLD